MTNHVLIVTRHYPPAVSGGARRPSLLAAGLRERGWRVTVATPVRPADSSDWIETPHPAGARGAASLAGSTELRASSVEQMKVALRRALYWPDGDVRWALRAARSVIDRGVKPDWVISTSPPESAHLAARLIQEATGARWLAELRDSWIDDPLRDELRTSAFRRSIERMIARRLLSKADRIVVVSEAIATEVSKYVTSNLTPIVIGHFARAAERDFAYSGAGPHLLHTGRFSLSHPERRIETLLAAFGEAASDLPNSTLHLVGLLTSDETKAVKAHRLAAHIRLHGEVPQEEALAMQKSADALILYQPATAALPGKLGEYLLSSAPILTLGEGPWLSRMDQFPHHPLMRAREALTGGKRRPIDSSAAAIDAYEQILRET